MARYLICPDESTGPGTVQYAVLTDSRLHCRDSIDHSSQWIELASQPNLLNLTDILTSLSEFDLTTISMFITAYLVIFIIGYTAGNILRLMKKT